MNMRIYQYFIITSLLVTCIAANSTCFPRCADGWFRSDGHCYYYSRLKRSYSTAKLFCDEHNGTLVVFENQQELNVIREHMTINTLTWIGLAVRPRTPKGTDTPKWEFDLLAMDEEDLPWLLRGHPHGHRRFCFDSGQGTRTNCVAYFRPELIKGHYVNYYPCHYPHYFICKSRH